MSSRHHHDELFRAERVLRARAARQGYLFRQMKRRDTQLAAQLTSLGKACEVARGSPVASLLVPVAMREQGLSSKLLAFEKQLENHEVAVLELERQVAVLELGDNFKQLSDLVHEAKALEGQRQVAVEKLEAHFQRLSDRVNETQVLEGERQLAVVELEGNFQRLSDRVNETQALEGERQLAVVELEGNFKWLSERVNEHLSEFKGTSLAVAELGVNLEMRGRDFGELTKFVLEDIKVAGRLHDDLQVKVLHVDQQVTSLVEWSNDITTTLNDVEGRVDNLEQWGEELAQSM